MKKQITLAALGLLTLAGGSWLAAQQRDPVRATRSTEAALPDEPADVSEARAGEDPADRVELLRPSASSPKRATGLPSAQTVRGGGGGFLAQARGFEDRFAGQQIAVGRPARMTPEEAARMRAFQDAIKELREAEGADEKASARENVTKLVSEQLDADLESREKELAAIEQRAKELRKQLEERKTAKPELLKMLVMLIDNPQVGLGIPPEWMQMLMRGQPDRYREGFSANYFGETIPDLPPRPAEPPTFDSVPRRNAVDENAENMFLKRDTIEKPSRSR
ncbi:MAG: hypothetical protein SFV81_14935 [Pirellulaceae bacterium]|nr:hypothetical protein [Pirellulaceae bacterium]